MKKKNTETCTKTSCSSIVGNSQPYKKLCHQLLKNSAIRGWEKLFVRTLSTSANPGKRQIEKLEAIASRLGYCDIVEEGGET